MALVDAARSYAGRLQTLRRRAEFQRLRGGVRWAGQAFVLEGKARLDQTGISGTRFGFTITKKIGKAHERNRMRRRLSHALRVVQIPTSLGNWDCVIVARRAALDLPFDALIKDFDVAIARLARSSAGRPTAPVSVKSPVGQSAVDVRKAEP